MEYILELTSANQLPLPGDLVNKAGLKPGSHFEARIEANRVIIEQLPFSSLEEGKLLEKTIENLQRENRII